MKLMHRVACGITVAAAASDAAFVPLLVQQDGVSNGIRLDCGHIFCEECISEWLERDRTCPMCRANVKPPGLHSYGDGATSLLPSVF